MFNIERRAERELNRLRSEFDVIYYLVAPTFLITALCPPGTRVK